MNDTLKIAFAGTSSFAVPCLQALITSPHIIAGVFTQPDRPAGRGQRLTPTPIKVLAQEHNLPLYQPESWKDVALENTLKALSLDVFVVVAYGMLLPSSILSIPRKGCINVHASLLPRWRGASPIAHAILAGDKKTGVSIIQMRPKLDVGEIFAQVETRIHDKDTTQDLWNRLSLLGADLLTDTLPKIAMGILHPKEQDEHQATYAHKIHKSDARLDWYLSAIELDRRVRAFNPTPVAFTSFEGQPLRIWRAQAVPDTRQHAPGTFISYDEKGIYIATGEGLLCVTELQMPGKRSQSARDFMNAYQKQIVFLKTKLD